MFSSVNENNVGFSAVGQEELEKVNGGIILPPMAVITPILPLTVAAVAVAVTVAVIVGVRRKR